MKPLYLFGVEVGVQNELGAEVYGVYFALLNSAFLLQIINDFGIQIFNNRQIALDRNQRRALVPGLIALKLILSALYLLLLGVLGHFLNLVQFMPLLMLIGVNLILTSFVLFLRSGISGLGYYRIDSVLSVLDKFLMLIIVGGMLIVSKRGEFTLYHFILGQLASLFLTLIFSWILIKNYSSLRLSWFSYKQLKNLAVKAMPYAIVVFLMTLYTRLDGVMIMSLLADGEYETGVYAAGYRILDALNMVAFLFAALLLPMFSNVQASPSQLRILLDAGFRYMLILVIPSAVFGILFREEIMMILYIQADSYWGDVFALLIATFILMGMMYVFGTFLTAIGHVWSMNVLFATTVMLNVLLNFLLIPKYKAAGAATATLITQFFAVSGICVLCIRILSLKWSFAYLLRVIGFSVLCLVSGLWVVHITPWYWSLSLYIPCVVLGAFIFRILSWRELSAMMQRA